MQSNARNDRGRRVAAAANEHICHCEERSDAAIRNLRWYVMTYYVYILTNTANVAVYTGVTKDLVRRVYEHKHHLDPDSFTAKYGIDKLVYFEATSDIRSAIEREKQIKSWSRARKNMLVEQSNPRWEDLYPRILG